MTDFTGTQTWTYDDDGNVINHVTTYTGLQAWTIGYTYNPDGSRLTMNTPAGGVGYSYDGVGRMSSLTDPGMTITTWTYLANGWLASQKLGNGVVTNYNYNARGFLTDMNNNANGGTLLSDFGSMTYDAVGNRTALTANIPAAPALAGATSYSYDTRNELLNETSARNGGYVNNFGYDGAENPTTFKGAPNTFNADNQNAAYAFDGNGNPSTYKGVALSFDPENRLTSYGMVLTAGYDGDGLRAWKNTAAGKTYFVYDGDAPVLELDESGNVTAFNVWGANGLLSRRTGTTSVYYTFDPQGSVVQRLDANQNILSTSAYDAWGNPLVPNPNDPFGYEAQWGYYTDNETGLLILTHRYYDPTQGRFVTRDPIRYAGGLNLYGYVGNEVIYGADPFGLIVYSIGIGFIG